MNLLKFLGVYVFCSFGSEDVVIVNERREGD